MGALRNYLETIFSEFPHTENIAEAKQELLAEMEEHYTSLRRAGRSEQVAIGIVIGEHALVDDLKESLHLV
ncbi:hypothetical protein JZO70_06995 [Enterococcus sp. 669A]|uniref:Uncharacterized protein n=1 Tax=Candidatus Enterococcus moelleringii TaxID=2815325 RepID=A0ABS3LBW0_9ENTE|nr:hypothetical protein [Enterococcus sp. 669A]MBO1305899.1 hypothetical protein [Enterococcus sp. 669A]